jgi:ABC-2 type transport system permease protein
MADCLKVKRSGYYPIVLGAPLIITLFFILWSAFMPHNPQDVLRYYILVLSILSSIIIGMSVYIPFETERRCCNYKEMLSTGYGRKKQLTSKIGLLFLFDLCSLVVSVFIFYSIFQYGFGYHLLTVGAYLYLIFIIYTGRLILILFHVWISLIIGKGGSIGIGIGCTFLNGMLMTEFGNGIWYWFPCSWGTILSHIYIACSQGAYLTLKEGITLINNTLFYFTLITLIALFLLLFWFSTYERKS